MNIASFLQPKIEVTFLQDNMTLDRAIEILKHSGYSAVPVIDKEERYVGVVSEGDFLWSITDRHSQTGIKGVKSLKKSIVRDIIRFGRVRAVCIDTDMEELLEQAKNQNFVPVVDDRNVFIGIVTRRDIITYFARNQKKEQVLQPGE